MKVRPLGDRILVEAIEKNDQQIGGFMIPASVADDKMLLVEGKVIAIGPGRYEPELERHIPIGGDFPVKVGDVVKYGKFFGMDFTDGQKWFKLLDEKDIRAVVEDE